MSEEKNVPRLRFPGFTEPWEQRKVSEITTSYSGGTPKASIAEYYGGEIPFIRSGEIYGNATELFITKEGMKNSSAKMVHIGNILYALYGATSGEVSRAKLDGAINQAILAIIPNADINANFLVEWFRKEKEKITDRYLQGGQGNLSAQIIKELEVHIPSSGEQNKIGEYFSALDHLITLHQRKLEHVKDLKKSMLQKMFPKNGQSYPEVRFPGFTDAWEQRKLGEVLESMQNNTLSRAELSNEQGSVMNVHYGDVLVKFGEVLNVSEEQLPMIADDIIVEKYKSSFLQNGDVIIADTAEDETVGKCTEIANLQEKAVVSGLHTIPYRPLFKFASGYLGYYMNSAAYHNQLLPLMQGIKVTSISKSSMQNTDIVYPKSVNEQKQIGDYFCKLDRLITLHQRELDHLQLLKKGMLQQMFV